MQPQEKRDEFWLTVVHGKLDEIVARLLSVSSRDSRRHLWDRDIVSGDFVRSCFEDVAFGYVLDRRTVSMAMAYIHDPIYNPRVDETVVPRVQNAAVSGGNTLTCDSPPTNMTVFVFRWDDPEFTFVGDLDSNPTPGTAGDKFVLVIQPDSMAGSDVWGLPSSLLEITV